MDSKNRKTKILITVITMMIALPSGFLVAAIGSRSDMNILAIYFIFLVSFLFALVLQTAIHEAGHLVFGVLTGFRFLSYRVLSLLIVKENGKLKFKNYTVAGTLGQCLLGSPVSREKKPYFLYNAGGVIFNLISAVLCCLIGLTCKNTVIAMAAVCNGMYSMIMFFSNSIPFEGSGVANDGRNIQEMTQYPDTIDTFYTMLDLNEQQMNGARGRDIPDSMIDLRESTLRAGGLGASNLMRLENKLIDQHDFPEAEKLILEIQEKDYPLLGFQRNIMMTDLKYIECLERRFTEITDQNTLKYIKSSEKSGLSVIRYLYARALYQSDPTEADRLKELFDKLQAKYPYPGDYQSEKELMEIADQILRCPESDE